MAEGEALGRFDPRRLAMTAICALLSFTALSSNGRNPRFPVIQIANDHAPKTIISDSSSYYH
jgi:hypothetical protein